jgi:phosphotransferase system enzyme I (PtsP)
MSSMTTPPPTDAITIRPPPTSGASESIPPPAPVGGKAVIHGKGEIRLDRVLDFVSFVTKPMPLSLLLDEAPKRIASIVQADIVSLYLLEGDGATLVLRGNVGFSGAARGKVRLSVGEGLTGMAVECMRPVSAVQAPEHARWRAFPELEEARYPVFLAVPILGHNRALGAIVVQRAGERAFKPSDVRLLVSLTAPIASAVRHAQVLDELREKNTRRRTGGGTRKVTLPGVPVVSGRCLGAVAALRRPATSPTRKAGGEDAKLLKWAFDTAEKALTQLVGRAYNLALAREATFLSNYLLMVSDGRMRSRAFELIGEGLGVAQALGTVAREAVRAANGIVGDPFMQERARDMEDLCDALLMLASPDARAELPSKAVLIGDQLTVFDLLVSSRAHPVGVALTERAAGPRTQVLLKLLGVPAIVDTESLFRWASPGDVVLIDADHGFLVINPSRAEMASLRAERRKEKPSEEEDEGAFDGDTGD